MVYIDNTLDEQHVYIPRNDNQGSYESSYDKGYQDGFSDGLEECDTCQLQDKEVVLTAVTQTVTADEGYAGMERVFVDGRQLATEKYVEGYNDGEENGVQEQKDKLATTAFTQNGIYTREDGWNEVEVDVACLNCNLENKTQTLESGDTSPWIVYPDSGYDGMAQVVISDNGYGQSKYDEGFEDGQASCPPCPPCPEPEIESGVTYELQSGFTGVTITPSSGYDGMSDVTITDNGYGQEKYDEGEADGYQNGYQDGRDSIKLTDMNVTMTAQTQTFSADAPYDGIDEITVDASGLCQSYHDSGVTEGENNILSGMTSTAFTRNDTYQNPSGWSAVTVNVPTGSSCNLESKTYQLESGFTGTTVLPSSGYDGMSAVTITDNGYGDEKFSEGYDQGYEDGGCDLQTKSVILTAETQTILPDWQTPTTPNGEDMYGGNVTDFETALDYGRFTIAFWSDSGHTDSNEIGWFTQDRSTNDFCFYNYQSDTNYIIRGMSPLDTDLNINEWTSVGGVGYDQLYLYYDTENLWFYTDAEHGMYCKDTDIDNIIYPVELYDGMSEVNVDASSLCNDYYNDGYNDAISGAVIGTVGMYTTIDGQTYEAEFRKRLYQPPFSGDNFVSASYTNIYAPNGGGYGYYIFNLDNIPAKFGSNTSSTEKASRLSFIKLPDTIDWVTMDAFAYWVGPSISSNLYRVIMPCNLLDLDYRAFEGCPSLKEIVCTSLNGPAEDPTNKFMGLPYYGELILPSGCTNYTNMIDCLPNGWTVTYYNNGAIPSGQRINEEITVVADLDFVANNWNLYNTTADTTNLVSIEVNGVAYTGQTYNGQVNQVVYKFNGGIPNYFFKDMDFGFTSASSGSCISVFLYAQQGYIGNGAFENVTGVTELMIISEYNDAVLTVKTDAVKNTGFRTILLIAVTRTASSAVSTNLIIEQNAIVNNSNLSSGYVCANISESTLFANSNSSMRLYTTDTDVTNKSWFNSSWIVRYI